MCAGSPWLVVWLSRQVMTLQGTAANEEIRALSRKEDRGVAQPNDRRSEELHDFGRSQICILNEVRHGRR